MMESVSTEDRIVLPEKFNIYSLNPVKQDVLNALNAGSDVLADASKVTEADSAAVQFLISCKNEFRNSGRSFSIVSHSSALLDLLDIYGLVGFFEDRIRMSQADREKYSFQYGTKRPPKGIL